MPGLNFKTMEWGDAYGNTTRIKDMDYNHLVNIRNMLDKKSIQFPWDHTLRVAAHLIDKEIKTRERKKGNGQS